VSWRSVCRLDEIPVERGVCALLDGRQVALFRTAPGVVHALDNRDPFSGAMVLSRGIVGSREGEATVASPMYKQVFALETGVCLDDPTVRVRVHDVRVRAGAVEVAVTDDAVTEVARQPA
jgi:nitrite reductase (NADH) small subunit